MKQKLKCVCVGLVLVIALVFSAGCVQTAPLSQEESTIRIASLGGEGDPFMLWEDEPGCCKVLVFYKIEPDGGYTIQDVPEDQSRIYKDADVNTSRILVVDGRTGAYLNCPTDKDPETCMYWEDNAVYNFHVPNGTVIRQRGSSGRDSGDDNSESLRAYSAYRMVSTGGQRII